MKNVIKLIVLIFCINLQAQSSKNLLDAKIKAANIEYEMQQALIADISKNRLLIQDLKQQLDSLKLVISQSQENTTSPPDPDATSPVKEGLAFRGAKGAGAYTTGGKGGVVIPVTTLCWSCDGGLKKALQTPGARTIIFNVSGQIDASTEFFELNGSQYDNLTIAGESAPNGGITIKTNYFVISQVNNVVLSFVRFRGATYNRDAFAFAGGKDIIVSNCSFSYGGDEAFSVARSFGVGGNVTIQNCLLTDSKTGTILGVDNTEGNYTFVNNVFANTSHRFTNTKGNGRFDIINNLVYNWKYRLIRVVALKENPKLNVIGNYYKPSKKGLRKPGWFADGTIKTFAQKLQVGKDAKPLIYTSGNIIEGQTTPEKEVWTIFAGSYLAENSPVPDQYFIDEPFALLGEQYTVSSADQTYNTILENIGANKTLNADGTINYYQDQKDAQIIEMIKADSYSGNFYNGDTRNYPVIPTNKRPENFDTNNDGVPDAFAQKHGFAPSKDLSNYTFPNGGVGVYGWLFEVYK